MTVAVPNETLRGVKLVLPVVLAALAFVSCGGDTNQDPSPTAKSTPPGASAIPSPSATPGAPLPLVVANSTEAHVSLVNAGTGKVDRRVQVGPAPFRIAVGGDIGYITTANSLVVFNLRAGQVLATLPLQTKLGPPGEGEFREGGMGVAVSPDGERVFVGVYSNTGSFLEVFHTRNGYERSIPIGVRPFDVVVSPSGGTVYSIDHDSFTLTAVQTATWTSRTIEVAPLGKGAFDKPHYAAIAGNELLLPFQGKTLLAINLETGSRREIPLTANTHQHGIAVTADATTAVIVGTGPAGGATDGPSLTILELATGKERIIPLSRPHELVALSRDGKTAYLSGGYLLTGGWDGITVVDLESGSTREIAVTERPLGIIVLGR